MAACKDCRHFRLESGRNDRGQCASIKDYMNVSDRLYSCNWATETFQNDRAYCFYDPDFDQDEEPTGEFIVGINFGCIHFNAKE